MSHIPIKQRCPYDEAPHVEAVLWGFCNAVRIFDVGTIQWWLGP